LSSISHKHLSGFSSTTGIPFPGPSSGNKRSSRYRLNHLSWSWPALEGVNRGDRRQPLDHRSRPAVMLRLAVCPSPQVPNHLSAFRLTLVRFGPSSEFNLFPALCPPRVISDMRSRPVALIRFLASLGV
jgi:hypothetical protein